MLIVRLFATTFYCGLVHISDVGTCHPVQKCIKISRLTDKSHSIKQHNKTYFSEGEEDCACNQSVILHAGPMTNLAVLCESEVSVFIGKEAQDRTNY